MDGKTGTLGRLKRLAGFGEGEEEDPDQYRCRSCGAGFDVQYHVCPECGGYSVDTRRDVEAAGV